MTCWSCKDDLNPFHRGWFHLLLNRKCLCWMLRSLTYDPSQVKLLENHPKYVIPLISGGAGYINTAMRLSSTTSQGGNVIHRSGEEPKHNWRGTGIVKAVIEIRPPHKCCSSSSISAFLHSAVGSLCIVAPEVKTLHILDSHAKVFLFLSNATYVLKILSVHSCADRCVTHIAKLDSWY